MIDSGLPLATPTNKPVKIGDISVMPKKPTQSTKEAKKGLENLKKAAQEKVFIEHEPTESE